MRRKTKYPGVTQIGPGKYELRAQIRVAGSDRWTWVRKRVEAASTEEAADAQRKLRADLVSARTEGPASPQYPTLTDYARSWLARRKTRGAKPSTLARAAQVLEQGILPVLGDRRVDEIRKNDVEEWLSWAAKSRSRKRRIRSSETINGWLRLLKTVLRDAVGDLDLPRDPTFRVKALPARPTRITDEQPNSLTDDELRRLLDAMSGETAEIRALCVVGFFTGMRFGEISALTWNDVREDAGLLLIRRSHWRGKVTTTKTGKNRSAALHPVMLGALREQRKALLERHLPAIGAALVFPSATGGYHTPSYLEKPFRRILKAAKIDKHLSAHGMRRTFNNLMRQARVDRVVLHATIGHSSESMTEHYSNVRPEEKLAAVNQLVESARLDQIWLFRWLSGVDRTPAPAAPSS